ncbi:n-acetylglutamate synthase [Thiomicrorhabdus sp. HH1]|uniref:N-acetylglutamate synthase n=1 Tax=Thiomicrorhabdus heinhorstiae TaxID=2748010 RepID=A0ABS0BTV7_9GAMM|nr:n-acetylglutamate synthase [Thiomicrorhabdus heinhorstiae]
MAKIDYDKRRFHTWSNSGNGEVGEETLFDYHQQDNLVTATYKGGEILSGHLIAKVLPDQRLDMRYHHLNRSGDLKIGTCISTPRYLEDGRLSLDEVWQWLCDDFSCGQSRIVEFTPIHS